jgi:hypothetical protein
MTNYGMWMMIGIFGSISPRLGFGMLLGYAAGGFFGIHP